MAHLEGGAACEKNKAEHGGGAEAGREGGGATGTGTRCPVAPGGGAHVTEARLKGGGGAGFTSHLAQRKDGSRADRNPGTGILLWAASRRYSRVLE